MRMVDMSADGCGRSEVGHITIAPSILAADFACLGAEVAAVTGAGAGRIHVDVMDGHFVPNLSLGPAIVQAIRPYSSLPFDVHLMIAPFAAYLRPFAEAGADIITVHIEACADMAAARAAIDEIHRLGKQAGIAISPGTPATALAGLYDCVAQVLVMTIQPGFGGQSFMSGELAKIAEIRAAIDASGYAVDLEVDGGISADTAGAVCAAGANMLVAGTAIYGAGQQHYAERIAALQVAGGARF